ncbi:dihydrolipoamide acetyltransferase family protein [Denitratisoma oestradiolicum]|uniref:dihydrolipoamide acetyltransferase family protein n=1 Tax=Denitratisoma oestradiolicum TaxID=311182 RepID=UPI0018D81E9F|nr:dihydrolipoamide acetyltransferase family protein [Denitratisoma oestradiolicum]
MDDLYEVRELSALRKIIAQRMSDATQTIPHFRAVMDIEVDTLLAVRKDYNAREGGVKVSVNDFIIKAVAHALMEEPAINVQFVDGMIHQYRQADISVVVEVDGGLVTPIIRAAEQKSLSQIGVEVRELAARGRGGRLKMNEVFGGSFSVSNLGGYGIDAFDAIINAPQGAILAVGAAKQRPWIREGQLVPAGVMRVVLSMDHRIIDGATGARFLGVLRDTLQSPASLTN